MSIGHHPAQNQHTPDMRKKDSEVTESEKAEAKRRIEGSLAPERDNDGADQSAPSKLNPMAASLAG
jgi:phosphatidylserine decarboxylase